jgi:hypothetical protein
VLQAILTGDRLRAGRILLALILASTPHAPGSIATISASIRDPCRGLDQNEESSGEQQHDGQNQAGLNEVIEPETLADMNWPGEVLHEIDHQEVKQVNAVAHSDDVGDQTVGEVGGPDAAAKRRQVEHNNHEGQGDVPRHPAPDTGPAASRRARRLSPRQKMFSSHRSARGICRKPEIQQGQSVGSF